MENWGLITYRETSLLFDPRTSSASDKLWVTRVIAHELAHQWFGNLVTMEWWNDIWLNEGFATYMELISVNATYPELQIVSFTLLYIIPCALRNHQFTVEIFSEC